MTEIMRVREETLSDCIGVEDALAVCEGVAEIPPVSMGMAETSPGCNRMLGTTTFHRISGLVQ